MSSRNLPDHKAIAANGHSQIPADTIARNGASSVRSRWDYAIDSTAENGGYKPADRSSLALTPVDAAKLIQTLQQLEGIARRKAARIAIKVKGKILVLNVAEIVALEAQGNYISLRHGTNSYSLRESLACVAEKLKPYGFMRIHRSVIVNISAVEEFQPLPSGEYRLSVKGGKEYLVSRTYKHNLRDLAQLWVGSEQLRG